MLITESDTDIEASELPPIINKSGDIAFIYTVVSIGNFGNVRSKEISGACIGVFLAKTYLSLPERMADN